MSWNKLNTFIIFLFIGSSIVTSMNIPISHCKNGTHLFKCKDGTFQLPDIKSNYCMTVSKNYLVSFIQNLYFYKVSDYFIRNGNINCFHLYQLGRCILHDILKRMIYCFSFINADS